MSECKHSQVHIDKHVKKFVILRFLKHLKLVVSFNFFTENVEKF